MSKPETAAFVSLSTLGYSGSMTVPIWLHPTLERFDISVVQGGLLASLELGCIALAAIVTAACPSSGKVFGRLMSALVISLVANVVVATTGQLAIFVGALALLGLSYGVLLAETTRSAARSDNSQRLFFLQQFGLISFAVIFFTSSPKAVAVIGAGAPFMYGVVLAAISLPLARLLPMPEITVGATTSLASHHRMALGMTFLAVVIAFLIQNAIFANIALAAAGANISFEALGNILAAGAIANILAPVAGIRVGLKWGRTLPIVVGYCGLALSVLLLTSQRGVAVFTIGAIGLNLFLLFLYPYLKGLMARLDPSGRGAAAGPAFLMIGSAIGPALGGMIISGTDNKFFLLGVLCALAAAVAIVLALGANSRVSAHAL